MSLLGRPKKRVFISFHMDDQFAKQLLVEQARSEKFDLEFINYALNEPFSDKWKTRCRERINQTSTTICLIGQNTHTREAVAWELKTSYELGKAVFGVRIHSNRYDSVPYPLLTHNAPILPWRITDIVAELNREYSYGYPFNF